jgi:glycosyltransferase involved in cell wall biosynthesis
MSKIARPSVGIAHPRLGHGGSEAVAMWGAEALKQDFTVSILTTGRTDLEDLNRFYGTTLKEGEVTIGRLWIPGVLSRARGSAALRAAFFQRAISKIAVNYDVLFSAYNPCDFTVPGIHLLDLSWDEQLRNRFAPLPDGIDGIFHRVRALRAFYLVLTRMVARPSGRDLFSGEDRLLANSHWAASLIETEHGVRCGVLYPPVPSDFPDLPFERRKNEFVCLGRISHEKRLERILEILGKVRGSGHDLKLHILGGPVVDSYGRQIAGLARGLSWVALEGTVDAEKKARLLTECRYGIHGADGEAFGIAVAEMVKAGCITFAPAEGGPAEILNDPRLLYRDVDDAVNKITAVLREEELRTGLVSHLQHQAKRFSVETFVRDFRAIVEEFLTRPKTARTGPGFAN